MSDETKTRNKRLSTVGTVVGAKMEKTISVQVSRMERHPVYGKYIRRYTKYYAHDENNQAKEGDVVEIMQTRPLSKLKRWRLVRVVQAAPELS